jgi:ABC-type dipeptide/oligopeptide/nickel transport system permease subunit
MEKDLGVDDNQQDGLMTRTLWLNTKIIALSAGLVCGGVIFFATNWLVIKGGDPVGPHLQLLSQFFWGYRVTFLGSLVGFIYGLAMGAVWGGCAGWIYNMIAGYRNRN